MQTVFVGNPQPLKACMPVLDVEIVSDHTASSRCDEGFLRLRRLMVRNIYADGRSSRAYPCDVVSRPHPDAAAVLLYDVDPQGRVQVVLKKGLRPPVYFRKLKAEVTPDREPYLKLIEMVAGVLEPEDAGPDGIARRAAAEAFEEAGFTIAQGKIETLGAEAFASPGVTDEKVFFCAGRVQTDQGSKPQGDGSMMEEGTEVVILELQAALTLCRSGGIVDMKTELALWRLADHLGYLPQLDLFQHQLPAELQLRYNRLGLQPTHEGPFSA